MTCPNKNTDEFKRLVKQLGSEEAAIYVWKAYGDNYPPSNIFKPTTEIKKELGVKSQMSLQGKTKLAGRVARYNKLNGTSHHFVAERMGQADLYKINFKINYLPKDHAQKQLDLFNQNPDWTPLDSELDNPEARGFERDLEYFMGDEALYEQDQRDLALNKIVESLDSVGNDASQLLDDDALVWYESLVTADGRKFSDVIPLNVMFNVINTGNSNAIATWTRQGITLYRGSRYNDIYHEAFHAYTQMFLEPDTRLELYDEVRRFKGYHKTFNGSTKAFADFTNLEAEEYLAELFQSYMNKPKSLPTPAKGFIQRVFDRIKTILKALFGNANETDILFDPLSNKLISSLFNNLRVGNLNDPVNKPGDYSVLNKTITTIVPIDPNYKIDLSYNDIQDLVMSVDYLIGEYLSQMMENDPAILHKYVNTYETKKAAYIFAKTQFEEQLEKLKDHLANKVKETQTRQRSILINRINKLQQIVDNFEIPYNAKTNRGVMALHMSLSSFQGEIMEYDNVYAERSGNEINSIDYVKAELKIILSTAIKRLSTKNDIVIPNQFGTPKLFSFNQAYNILNNILNAEFQNKHSLSMDEIYKILSKYITKNDEISVVAHFLKFLGKPSASNSITLPIWLNIEQTMGLPTNDIMRAEVVVSEVADTKFFDLRHRNMNTLYDKIQSAWIQKFSLRRKGDEIVLNQNNYTNETVVEYNHEYILKYINELLEKKASGLKIPLNQTIKKVFSRDEIDENIDILLVLFDMIGIELPVNGFIKEDLKNPDFLRNMTYMFEDLLIPMVDKKTDTKTYKFKSLEELYSNNRNRFKTLAKIKLKYSYEFSNPGITTVEKTTQFEQGLSSTLNEMVSVFNTTVSFRHATRERTDGKSLNHLSPDRNPWVTRSRFLAKLYSLSPGETEYPGLLDANKQELVSLNFVDGLSLREAVNQLFGMKNLSLDPNSKLIEDITFLLSYGVSESHRHGDKNTTPLIKVGDNNDAYIKLRKFFRLTNPELSGGYGEYAYQMKLYLYAEIDRIIRAKSDESLINATVSGTKRTVRDDAMKFGLFDGILSPVLKNRIYDVLYSDDISTFEDFYEQHIKNPESPLSDLLTEFKSDLQTYFVQRVDEIFDLLMDGFNRTNTPYIRFFEAILKKIANDERIPGSNIDIYKEVKESGLDNLTLLKRFISGFVANDMIHKVESTIFYGDFYNFNQDKDDWTKRIGAISSTGKLVSSSQTFIEYLNNNNPFYDKPRKYDGTLNAGVVKDSSIDSFYYEDWLNYALTFEEKRLKKADPELKSKYIDELKQRFEKAYKGMDDADAQGYITFPAYRLLSMSMNEWNSEKEELYNKIMSGQIVTNIDITTTFPVKKFQYFGPLKTNGLPVYAFHKYSLYPLIPTNIQDTNLEVLMNKMMEQDIDYLTFGSGSKGVSLTNDGKNLNGFYKEGGEMRLEQEDNDYQFTKNTIYTRYLKNQLVIHDYFKETVIFSTQFRKLAIAPYWNEGLPIDIKKKDINKFKSNDTTNEEKRALSRYYALTNDFENSVSNLTEFYMRELKEETSLDVKTGVIGDKKKLLQYISNALTKREIPTQYIELIQTFERSLKDVNFDFMPNAQELEKIFTGLIYKKLVNQRANGEALVQVSNVGFEKPGTFSRSTSSRSLKSYRLENGVVQPMEVKIAIQGKFKNLLQQREVLDYAETNNITQLEALNILIKDQEWLSKYSNLITMMGVRIPVQGMNSMEMMRVEEFFPESSGSIIVVPSEIVGKSGSDFDVDKLSIVMPNINVSKDGVTSLPIPTPDSGDYYDLLKQKKELLKKINKIDFDTKNLLIRLKDKKHDSLDLMQQARFKKILKDFYKKASLLENEMKQLSGEDNDAYLMELEILNNQREQLQKKLSDDLFNLRKDILQEFKKDNNYEDYINELKIINNKLALNGKEGHENTLLASGIALLSTPEAFFELITPNTTITAKNNLADEIKKLRGLEGRKDISRIYDALYHINKLDYNNVGKVTLGIGAVDNTFNILANRVGLTLNKEATVQTSKGDFKLFDITLPFKHNITDDGRISMGHKYDADGVYMIGDIISQLMNGWVDVAKDEWIFFIQGNKDISPVLLYLIQSGVPISTAGYFVAQPILLEYYANLRAAKGIVGSSNPNIYPQGIKRNTIVNMLMDNLPREYHRYFEDVGSTIKFFSTLSIIESNLKNSGQWGDEITLDELKENMNKPTGIHNARYLIEFARMLFIADDITTLKGLVNFDTNRLTTAVEIINKLSDRRDYLNRGKAVNRTNVEKLLNETPIGAFNVQKESIELLQNLFNIRQKIYNLDILSEISNRVPRRFANTNDSKGRLIENITNGFIPFLYDYYRNIISYNDLFNDGDFVNGIEIKATTGLDKTGVAYKDGIIYFDPQAISYLSLGPRPLITLSTKFNSHVSTYDRGIYAPIPLFLIDEISRSYPDQRVANEYITNFVKAYLIMREIQRLQPKNSVENITQSVEFKYYEEILKRNPDLKKLSETSYKMAVYETVLRNRTLDAMAPTRWYFHEETSYANKWNILNDYHPFLKETLFYQNFEVVQKSQGMNRKQPIYGLRLNNIFSSNEEKFALYSEIKNLQDPDYIKYMMRLYEQSNKRRNVRDLSDLSDQKSTAQIEEITDFFKRFSDFAYRQDGFRPKDYYGTMSVADPREIYDKLSFVLSDIDADISYDLLRLYKERIIEDYNDPIQKIYRDTHTDIQLVGEDMTQDQIIFTALGDNSVFYDESGNILFNKDLVPGNLLYSKDVVVVTEDPNLLKATNEYTNHSGGAFGSDITWDEIGAKFGFKNHKHYYTGLRSTKNAPLGNTEVKESSPDYQKGRVEAARAANRNFGYGLNYMKDPRLIRNWSQVKYSEAIFAIGNIKDVGENLFPDIPGDTRTALVPSVSGGTGYAVSMAILNNKPVYVYQQTGTEKYPQGWYTYDSNIDDFVPIPTPVLTKNYAGIGTRNINEAGEQAIVDVYEKTLNNKNREQDKGLDIYEKLEVSEPIAIDNAGLFNYMNKRDEFFKSELKYTDKNFDKAKEYIDEYIANLKQLKDSGKTLIFDNRGIGLGLLGINFNKINVVGPYSIDYTNSVVYPVKENKVFDYLSQQLYDNFGYINVRSKIAKNIATNTQESIVKDRPVEQMEILREIYSQIESCK